MIVVKVINETTLLVIHYTKGRDESRTSIKREKYRVNPRYDTVYRIDYDSTTVNTGVKAVDKAEERIGEMDYNLLWNNCECFCTWVKVNKNQSSQSITGMAVGGVIGGVLTVVGITAAILIGAQRNKSSK